MTLSIRTKLFCGFGLVLALFAISTVVAFSNMSTMNKRAEVIAGRDLPSIAAIGQAIQHVEWYRATQIAHTISSSADLMTQREKTLSKEDASVSTAFAHAGAVLVDARDRTYLQTLQQQWRRYQAATVGVPALDRAGQVFNAWKLLNDYKPQMAKLVDGLTAWSAYKQGLAARDRSASSSAYSGARFLLLALAALALLAGAGIAFLLSRSIAARASRLLLAADGLAGGDVDQNVDSTGSDELARTGAAFAGMINYLRETAESIDRVAGGDLTVDVAPRSPRDLLGNSLARLTSGLREIVGHVSESARSVGEASRQMASTSEETGRAVGDIATAVGEVAHGAERQVTMIEDTRNAVEAAARGAASSATTAQETADAASRARDLAREGVDAAGRASDAIQDVANSAQEVAAAIQELASRSGQIGGIVDTITGIAEQTNLLALNAAIEAARAGEQGRGFAVVAEEVRKLAEESQSAAGQIAVLIEQIQSDTERVVGVVGESAKRTNDGVAIVEQTREAFLTIGQAVEGVSDQVSSIAAAFNQISAEAQRMEGGISDVASVAEESSASAEEVSASTQETSAATEQIAAGAAELARTAAQLEQLVQTFRIKS
jgi:methyl-accepting chemotaxis protein